MSFVTVIRHPTTGDRYSAEIGASESYQGEDAILRVAGPLEAGADPVAAVTSAGGETERAKLAEASDWLSAELGKTLGLPRENVFGETLQDLIGIYGWQA